VLIDLGTKPLVAFQVLRDLCGVTVQVEEPPDALYSTQKINRERRSYAEMKVALTGDSTNLDPGIRAVDLDASTIGIRVDRLNARNPASSKEGDDRIPVVRRHEWQA
jgi:hypothetical protein